MEKQIQWFQLDLFEEYNDDVDDDGSDEAVDSYFDKENAPSIHGINLNKLIQTPLGPMIFDDTFHPLKDLDIFTAHVNFPITHGLMEELDKVEGIEILSQIGRYRLLFAFGLLFDTEEVQNNIEHVLGVHTYKPPQQVTAVDKYFVDNVLHNITNEHWAAYVFPNGKYSLYPLSNKQEVTTKGDELKLLQKISGGSVFTSNGVSRDV